MFGSLKWPDVCLFTFCGEMKTIAFCIKHNARRGSRRKSLTARAQCGPPSSAPFSVASKIFMYQRNVKCSFFNEM